MLLWNVTASSISMHRHIFLSHLTGSHAACIAFFQLLVFHSFVHSFILFLSLFHFSTFVFHNIWLNTSYANACAYRKEEKKKIQKENKWTHAPMWQIAHHTMQRVNESVKVTLYLKSNEKRCNERKMNSRSVPWETCMHNTDAQLHDTYDAKKNRPVRQPAI